jgi:hypothetical protein
MDRIAELAIDDPALAARVFSAMLSGDFLLRYRR